MIFNIVFFNIGSHILHFNVESFSSMTSNLGSQQKARKLCGLYSHLAPSIWRGSRIDRVPSPFYPPLSGRESVEEDMSCKNGLHKRKKFIHQNKILEWI